MNWSDSIRLRRQPSGGDLSIGLKLSATATAIAMLLGGQTVNAQQAQGEEGDVLEEIVVTGSRITRTSGFTTAVPVTAVSIEDLTTYQPGTTIAEQLDQLPQFFGTQTAQRGGGTLFGSAGRSNVNMRALGANRTLVLLDGARISPADRDGSVHVDNIPSALISQVEIVTGGASAAYGADALAGVVNFRLNREFTGLNLDIGTGRTDVGDGDQIDMSVAFGTELSDRVHFIGSLEHQKIDQIVRIPGVDDIGSWFQRWGVVENTAYVAGGPEPRRYILPNVHSTRHTPTGKIDRATGVGGGTVPFSLNGLTFTNDGTGLRPFVAGDFVGRQAQSGGAEANIANRAFNGGPEGAEVLNQNYFAGLTFDANDSTRFFLNLMGGATESNELNRRGIPHLTSPWYGTIFAENAYLPESLRQSMEDEGIASFRLEKQGNVFGNSGDYGNNESRFSRYESWTLQLGLDKALNDNWSLQVRLQRGESDRDTYIANESRIDRRFLAIDAVEVYADQRDLTDDAGTGGPDGLPDLVAAADRGTGTTICNVQRYNPTPAQLQASVDGYLVAAAQGDRSLGTSGSDLIPIPGPIGPDNVVRDCVPMNVFGLGNVTPEAAAYVVSQKESHGAVAQEFAEVLVTGDLFDGIGAGPFGIAFGATYREQSFWQYGAPVDIMAYGPPRNADGSAGANFLDLGIRGIPPGYTGGSANLHEFSTVPVIFGDYDVWEAFAELNLPLWESGSGNQRFELDVAARYSDYSTSGGVNSNKVGINFQLAQPFRFRATVSRDVREPTFAERFNLQGGGGRVDDPQTGNLGVEITTTAGGNPNLSPEEADTVTAGFVLSPTGAPGFQFSMDWYEIDLEGAVGQLGAQKIVDDCFAGDAELCALIQRDPFTQAVTNVRNVFLNVNQAKVRGIDYEMLWSKDTNWFSGSGQSENLSVRVLAGRQLEDSTTSVTGVYDDNSNLWTQPDLTAIVSANYRIGPYGIRLQQRYRPGGTVLNDRWVQGVDIDNNTVQGQTTTDMVLSYSGELGNGASWQTSLSVTNIFDTDPPVVASFGQRGSSQTNPLNSFDTFGRRYMLNFRYSF